MTRIAMTPDGRILMWMCVLVAVNQLGFGAMIPTLALYA
jgi:DHA1 family multidrug resistance protein-like MFS transporter